MSFSLIVWAFCLVIQVIAASYLVQPFVLLLLYAFQRSRGKIPGRTPVTPPAASSFAPSVRQFQFGIIITAHAETDFIPPIVDSLLKQTHPFFNVYVVADNCNIDQLDYTDSRIHILSPLRPLNSQVASLEYGFRHFDEKDEICLIFDPDNLVHPLFLEVLNSWYNAGYLAVQGNIKAKNEQGVYARIDTLGMQFGSFVDRVSRSALNLSVHICGCGISVHRTIYERIIYDEKSLTGGFDKHLQADLAVHVPRIAYAADAIFYDEKVDDAQDFEKQRIRWIAAYFKFLGKAFSVFRTGFRKQDINLLSFGYNLMRPPYFLLLIFAVSMCAIDFFISPLLGQSWLVVLAVFTFSFLTIGSLDNGDRSFFKSIVFIPVLVYHQLRAFYKLSAGRRKLMQTRHTKVMYIEDLLEKTPPSTVFPKER